MYSLKKQLPKKEMDISEAVDFCLEAVLKNKNGQISCKKGKSKLNPRGGPSMTYIFSEVNGANLFNLDVDCGSDRWLCGGYGLEVKGNSYIVEKLCPTVTGVICFVNGDKNHQIEERRLSELEIVCSCRNELDVRKQSTQSGDFTISDLFYTCAELIFMKPRGKMYHVKVDELHDVCHLGDEWQFVVRGKELFDLYIGPPRGLAELGFFPGALLSPVCHLRVSDYTYHMHQMYRDSNREWNYTYHHDSRFLFNKEELDMLSAVCSARYTVDYKKHKVGVLYKNVHSRDQADVTAVEAYQLLQQGITKLRVRCGK